MTDLGVSSVDSYTSLLHELLNKGRQIKPAALIDPALRVEDLKQEIDDLATCSKRVGNKNYAAIETAVRNIFYTFLASNSIEGSDLGQTWNLLDIVTILSDQELCEPGLVFWLVEELLDSQTIDGCRVVFDYLDSRRERLTAKHFDKKNLIILRACNELLRRLSRAEDTVFCGRVFIFLFQSFPLGDRSSVNLRGEYHIENVTAFENIEPKLEVDSETMDVDANKAIEEEKQPEMVSEPTKKPGKKSAESGTGPKIITSESEKATDPSQTPNMDTLYSMFWSLQEYFSQPTRLFQNDSLEAFRNGVKLTMVKFKEIQKEQLARGTGKLSLESKRGIKRKRTGDEGQLVNSFNPKYLTSRDLFDLEVNDLSFRRHVLVQALILLDFLLSLTPRAKRKLGHATNKSVIYGYTLSDEDAEWASTTRGEIAKYLQEGPEGKFYYRMVDTVLSRDKNWVQWKAESCPEIARPPVNAEDFAEAEKSAQKAAAPKRLRPTVLGALDLKFLKEDTDNDPLLKFKDRERARVPTLESFKIKITEDDLDIEMAKDEEAKRMATERRASKMWRILRIASKGKFGMFDRIEDGRNLDILFEPEVTEPKENVETNGIEEHSNPAVEVDTQVVDAPETSSTTMQEKAPEVLVT